MESEIELVKGCRAGDNAAWKELYTLYSRQMLAVGYRYTGDVEVAHDLLHDGFIKLYTNFSYRGEAALGTWLNRVMANMALDYLRKKKKMQEVFVSDEVLPDIPELPDKEICGNIPEERLLAFVAKLPVGCRTVFNLYVFEDKSHKEIAEMLHIKEHSSTSQLFRAKYLLAKRIQEYINHEERE